MTKQPSSKMESQLDAINLQHEKALTFALALADRLQEDSVELHLAEAIIDALKDTSAANLLMFNLETIPRPPMVS